MRYAVFFLNFLAVLTFSSCWSDTVTPEPFPDDSPKIFGNIFADSGVSTSNVELLVMPSNKKFHSNEFGSYIIFDVPQGMHIIQASTATHISDAVSVAVNETESVEVNLRLRPRVAGNRAPTVPTQPTPAVGEHISNPNSATLGWQCSDPDNDPLRYDIFISSTADFVLAEKFAGGLQTPSFTLPPFFGNETEYFWRVIVSDNAGNVTMGPVWRFRVPDNSAAQLILWLPFDNSSINKSSIQINTAAYNIDYTSNRHRTPFSAMMCQGDEQSFAQVSPSDALNFYQTQDFSLSMWVAYDKFQQSQATLIAKQEFNRNTLRQSGWSLNLFSTESSKEQIGFYTGNFSMIYTLPDSLFVNANKWHHLVLLFKRSSASIELYIDGILATTFNDKRIFRSIDTQNPLTIGSSSETGIGFGAFRGGIDDLRIYKGILNLSEIKSLFEE